MKSIFDHWTKQIQFNLSDGQDGFCARGWIMNYFHVSPMLYSQLHTDVRRTEARIAAWIETHHRVPYEYRGVPGAVIAWANNSGTIDIEGFRRIDLLTQDSVPEEPELPTETTLPEVPTIIDPVMPGIDEPAMEPAAELELVLA